MARLQASAPLGPCVSAGGVPHPTHQSRVVSESASCPVNLAAKPMPPAALVWPLHLKLQSTRAAESAAANLPSESLSSLAETLRPARSLPWSLWGRWAGGGASLRSRLSGGALLSCSGTLGKTLSETDLATCFPDSGVFLPFVVGLHPSQRWSRYPATLN